MIDKILDKINTIIPEKWRWVLSHEGFRKYFKNTGWMFFGQMFALLVSFFFGTWLIRYLGPTNYGVLSYALSFGGLLGFLSYLVSDGILSRELVKHPEKRDSLLGTAFVLKLIGGAVALLLTIIAAFIIDNSRLSRVLIIIYSLTFIIPAFGVVGNFFQANVQAKQTVKAQMVAMAISSILKVAIIFSGLGIIWVMAVYVLDGLWSTITLWLIYRQNNLHVKDWHFDKVLAKSLAKDSSYLMLSSAAWFIYVKVDQVIIGRMMNETQVGLYAAAVKLSEIWNFIPGIICTSLFPAIVNARIKGDEVYRQRLKSLYWFLGLAALILAIPITILARPIVLFLFGPSYQASIIVLQIYIWTGVGMFLGAGVSQYMLAENMVKTTLFLSLLGMAVNIGLNLIWIPEFGLIGAAWASLVSYLVVPVAIFLVGNFIKKLH
jgi:O-antigen/teichoic acid export membrane protein